MEKLYKFRPLVEEIDLCRIFRIIDNGFYCCDFLSFNDFNEGVFPTLENSTVELNDKLNFKICSFSKEEALKSQLMWGHYAKAGMGVAIEIHVKEIKDKLEENEDGFIRVKYLKEKHAYKKVKDILTNKSSEWQYEQEVRYISSENNSDFLKLDIKKIHFGKPYKNLDNYSEILERHKILKEYDRLSKELEKKCEEKGIDFCEYDFRNLKK